MIVFRRRYLFWLIREYVKRWGKTFFFWFIIGLIVFFLLKPIVPFFLSSLPIVNKEIIGIVGAHTLDDLPRPILQEISWGLTSVQADGKIVPLIAKSWNVLEDGKKYSVRLKENIFFSDGKRLTSKDITYPFSDVQIERPEKFYLVLTLKNPYSPFLVTLSRPIFKDGFIGTGNYKVKEVTLNGNFVESLTLVSKKNPYNIKTYHFYPTEEALKMAFVLGEVSQAQNLSDASFKNTTLAEFPNVKVQKEVDHEHLVTLFYSLKDPTLSDEKIRDALSYVLPNNFLSGKRHYSPFLPTSWAQTNGSFEQTQDISHAKDLISKSDATISADTILEIKVLPKYKKTAQEVSNSFKKINLKTKIEVVDKVPDSFQIFLGDFIVSKDPDQYTLWHSNQPNNITNFKNLRVDKLLEDGRKTQDLERRKKIYSDFQKYLIEDSPASFLYFPYVYHITR